MSIFKPFAGAALLLLLVISCNNRKNPDESKAEDKSIVENLSSIKEKMTVEEIPVVNNDQVFDSTDSPKQQLQPPAQKTQNTTTAIIPDISKKIIKNASLKLEVKDTRVYSNKLTDKLKQYGAYISQEENNNTAEQSETVMAIKVPVQYFDDLLASLTGSDDKIIERSIKTDDVTGDIVDTKSRLEAKKQMRIKYLDFLKESKNMTEVLQVQEEINNIQEEIEAAAGRYASLSTQAAYSTIQLSFFKPGAGHTSIPETPGFFGKVSAAFGQGAGWLLNLLVGLISIWPMIAAIAIGIFIYRKRRPAKILPQNV